VAEQQIEAAYRVSLAKAEVGIRDKKPVSILREFIDNDFAPFVESRFASKPKTLEYYRGGARAFAPHGSWHAIFVGPLLEAGPFLGDPAQYCFSVRARNQRGWRHDSTGP
jgi:hypothetical protein